MVRTIKLLQTVITTLQYYRDIGDHSQSLELYEKELKMRVKFHGGEHNTARDYCNNLARVHKDILEYNQAIEPYEKELKIRVSVHAEEHGTVADCYNNLARVYSDTGERS